jgi:hypothetical protein
MNINSEFLTCEGAVNKNIKISCYILVLDGSCNAVIPNCETENVFDDFANTPEGFYLSEKVAYSDGAAYSTSTKIKHRQGSFGTLSSY